MPMKRRRSRAPRKRSGLPRTTRVSRTQTGRTTRSVDRKRSALKPGKRLSKSGRTYYEKRRNRSDKSRKTRL